MLRDVSLQAAEQAAEAAIAAADESSQQAKTLQQELDSTSTPATNHKAVADTAQKQVQGLQSQVSTLQKQVGSLKAELAELPQCRTRSCSLSPFKKSSTPSP